MHGFGAKEIHEDADSGAFQTVSIQKCGIGFGNFLDAKSGDRIVRIIAGHDVQHACSILNRSGDWTCLILRRAERDDSAPSDKAACWSQSNQTLSGVGRSNRFLSITDSTLDRK